LRKQDVYHSKLLGVARTQTAKDNKEMEQLSEEDDNYEGSADLSTFHIVDLDRGIKRSQSQERK
jgi:hypothetical protein